MDTILMYEELSLNSHPASQTQLYDGWLLRFANGYTKRANSVSPLYPGALDPLSKIEYCEEMYTSRGIPVMFKLTPRSDPEIDRLLEARGYAILDPTYLMSLDLRDKDFLIGDCAFTHRADDAWLDAFCGFSGYTDSLTRANAKLILDNVTTALTLGRLVKDGRCVACGATVIERGYAALLNIVVDGSQRGKGYGAEVCASLLAVTKNAGAHTAYLQVIEQNHVAVNLYKKLGFDALYTYWYRTKT